MSKEPTFKAGVLIIGSLFWDNTNGRRPWREHCFGENFQQHQIPVEVPIRYGRYSSGKTRECPTMVLSSEYHKEGKLGQGVFLPFKNQKQTISDLICSAKALSNAEGQNCNLFIKVGSQQKWCILLYYLNPVISKEKKRQFERIWKKQYNLAIDENLMDNFKMKSEQKSIFYKSGRVKGFPKELSDYDVILMTQTQPRISVENRSRFATPKEIAQEFHQKPEYFVKNRLNGITTADDMEIIHELAKLVTDDTFEKNAKLNGCSPIEISQFQKEHMRLMQHSITLKIK